MAKIVPPSFFRRPALEVAPELLGKFLVRESPNGTRIEAMITETEAYVGPHDLASHSSRGRTARTEAMFAPGGIWYVYLIYGLYHLLNIVVGEKDDPQAVLIRGVEGASGPGRVGSLFHISKADYGKPAARQAGLHIEDRGILVSKQGIARSARIGVDYSGPIWSKKKYRFYLKKFVKR